MIKAYINTPTKKSSNFQLFGKNILSEMKKANIIVSRTTLCTQKIKFCMQINFFGKRLFGYKFRFAVEKKTKKIFGSKFQNYLENLRVAIKKMPIIQFPYMGIKRSAFFFKKRKPRFLSPDCFERIKQPQKLVNIFFRNCMKIVWQAFFHTLDVWNCMISIFAVWRSTRAEKMLMAI